MKPLTPNQKAIKCLIEVMQYAHVYLCVTGSHYGVTVGRDISPWTGREVCPAGCHSLRGYWVSNQ